MKKVIREVDEKKGIIQITIADERWYEKTVVDSITGANVKKYVPSVTWISGCYPKGVEFYKWLANHGWDESQAIKIAAGTRGTKVHTAIDDVLQGKEVRIDSKYMNRETGQEEELTLDECDCILSFVNWAKEAKPVPITWEKTIFSNKFNYAGTIDLVCLIDGVAWIVDYKTGQSVWTEYELQVSAYKQALLENLAELAKENPKFSGITDVKLGILQVGYKRNKNQYKFTEVEYQFPLFMNARAIWEKEHGGEKPSMRDYPIILSPKIETV